MQKESIHEGHRERVRQRIDKGTFECLSDVEMLEYMLFFSIPRSDTNALAHALLKHFGSFSRVIEATEKELLAVKGVGNKSAQLLASYLPVFRFYHQQCIHADKQTFDSSDKILHFYQNLALGKQVEHAYAMFLNQSKRLIKNVLFSKGTYNQTVIFADQVVKEAITHNARYVIVAHNHTAGTCFPSEADNHTAEEIYNALRLVKKELLDFVIVDHFDGYSFKEHGIIVPGSIRNIYQRPSPAEATPPKFTGSFAVQDDEDF